MNNKFDELAKGLARTVMPRQLRKLSGFALKRFGVSLAAMALACFGLVAMAQVAGPVATTSHGSTACTVSDAAGDAVFPTDLYGASATVPPYLDMLEVSVSSNNGVFHFEVKMNAQIPANPSLDFSIPVNHMGPTVGILTDQKTAGTPFKFKGQTDVYYLNFLVGALYSFSDSGVGLPLGWSGFLLDTTTGNVVVIPFELKGDTITFDVSAALLGNPSSFQWVAACECDPVPVPAEKRASALLVDIAPEEGYANWPCDAP
jgi:hypothetical protein